MGELKASALVHSHDVLGAFEAFIQQMADELGENRGKGDRTGPKGWKTLDRKTVVFELFDHAAKLHMAWRDLEKAPSYTERELAATYVLEHAADVANLAMMCADVAGVLRAD